MGAIPVPGPTQIMGVVLSFGRSINPPGLIPINNLSPYRRNVSGNEMIRIENDTLTGTQRSQVSCRDAFPRDF